MGYASRFGRHDNAIAAPIRVSREELIQAEAFILLAHPRDIVPAIVDGGEKLFVQRALWSSNPHNFTQVEWADIYRRIACGSHLAVGAEKPLTLKPIACPN
jgi:hypothetical protein